MNSPNPSMYSNGLGPIWIQARRARESLSTENIKLLLVEKPLKEFLHS